MSPARVRGFSELYGSWKMIWKSRRAWRRASPSSSLSAVSPSRMRPAVISTSRITASAVVDLPEPLSPTRPKVVPRGTSNEMPSTACTLECGPHGTRRGSLKWTRRSLT